MPEFQTLVQCLQYWTDKLGDSPAFIFRDKLHVRYVMTWNKLYTLSGRFAAVLHGWGLTRGHLVVNTLPNCPERAVCEAGILMSGAASVNAQCLLADGSDLLRTLNISRASAVVIDPDVTNSPWDALKRYVIVSNDGNSVTSESLPELRKVYFVRRVEDNSSEDFLHRLGKYPDWRECDDINTDDVMSVFTTSGSTGFSKLVPYTHRHFFTFSQAFELDADRRIEFNIAPLGWLGGYFGATIYFGTTRVLCDVRTRGIPEAMPEFIWRSIQDEHCTNAIIPAVFLSQLVARAASGQQVHDVIQRDHGNHDVNSTRRDGDKTTTAHNENTAAEVRENTNDSSDRRTSASTKLNFAIMGGMPCTRSMVQAALVFADLVVVRYAATDFGLVSYMSVSDGDDYVDHDSGTIVAGVEVKIVRQDDEDVEVPVDNLGRILVKTHPTPYGYLNDPQLSAAAFTEDGYFRTGDVGRLDRRGHLIVEGRGGDAIMRGAYIFYPGWLEARIRECPGVDSVMVVGVPHPELNEELCACVVLVSEDVTMMQVRQFVEKDIVTKEDDPLSPRPRYYLRFESFPKTSTNKPLRKSIKDMAAEMLGLSAPS